MDSSLTTILSVIVGGAIAFLASYILEARKAKNEKYKYTREKVISVGEDFYRFSAYALMRLETLLDSYKTMHQYNTQAAIEILTSVDNNLQELLKKIGENNITITTADIFFGVSGVTEATEFTNTLKTAQADLSEKITTGASQKEAEVAFYLIHDILQKYIKIIQEDRLKIRKKISEILGIKST
jgi:hypothetical protein